MQTSLHLSSPIAGRRLVRRTTDERWNQGADAALVAGVLMRPLAVVAGVGRQSDDSHPSLSLVEGRAIVFAIRPRSMARHHGQNHMTRAIAENARLGKSSVGDVLPLFSAFFSSLHIVATGVARLEARAVQRCQG